MTKSYKATLSSTDAARALERAGFEVRLTSRGEAFVFVEATNPEPALEMLNGHLPRTFDRITLADLRPAASDEDTGAG